MRHLNDRYLTPGWAVEKLFSNFGVLEGAQSFYEPCFGKGNISDILKTRGTCKTGDIDRTLNPDYHMDAASEFPDEHFDVVITNPPFNQAFRILTHLMRRKKSGQVTSLGLLLRVSFLEPTYERGKFLRENPPNRLIVLPRISFTGDGKTDSVTCAWMIWSEDADNEIVIVEKS